MIFERKFFCEAMPRPSGNAWTSLLNPVGRNMRIASAVPLLLAACIGNSADAQMATPGSFAVSQDGAATYSIPIRVPPGIAGVEPKLALVYSSRAGNGPFGIGWSLTGLSAISRCPRTVAQDGVHGSVNFDANDRFCLDGKRLMLFSGTYGAAGSEYRTEIPTFSRIIANGSAGLSGPASFTVYTSSGLTIQYGATADSLINGQGAFTPLTWAMNRMQDRKGNYLTVSYKTFAGKYEYDVSQISYTGSTQSAPNLSVLLNYNTAARSDQISGFGPTGIATQMTQWVSSIQVLANSNLVRVYTPTYSSSTTSSRLTMTGLQECAPSVFGSITADACLPALTFTWSGGTLALTNFSVGQFSEGQPLGYQDLVGDVDGDGLSDLTTVWYSSSTGDAINPTYSDGKKFLKQPNALANLAPPTQNLLGDVTGDGRADYVWIGECVPNDCAQVAPANANGFGGLWSAVTLGKTYPDVGNSVFPFTVILGDVDGDGRADIIRLPAVGGFSSPAASDFAVSTFLSTGTGFAVPTKTLLTEPTPLTYYTYTLADLNADGCEDAIQIGTTFSMPQGGPYSFNFAAGAWLSNCSTLVPSTSSVPIATVTFPVNNTAASFQGNGLLPVQPVTGDFNGDGREDLVAVIPSMSTFPGTATWNAYVLLSKSTGLNAPIGPIPLVTPAASYDGTLNTAVEVLGIDVNGDGRTDLVVIYNNGGNANAKVFLWNGSTFVAGPVWSSIGPWDPAHITDLAMDINGDSRIDLVRMVDVASTAVPNVLTQVGPPFDKVTAISNGLGWSTNVTYAMLSEQNVIYPASPPLARPTAIGPLYLKGTGQTYPRMDYVGPMCVVDYTQVDSGAGSQNTTFFGYAGAVMDLQGRGFAGFSQFNAFNTAANVITSTNYMTTFPYYGIVQQRLEFVPTSAGAIGTLLRTVNNSVTTVAADNGGPFPYVNVSVDQAFEPTTGHALPTRTTNSTVDSWGEQTQSGVTTSDGFTQAVANSFMPVDTTNWYIGRVQTSAVTNTSPSIAQAEPGYAVLTVSAPARTVSLTKPSSTASATTTTATVSGNTGTLSYAWTVPSGSAVTISAGSASATPTFSATLTGWDQTVTETASLKVTDAGSGKVGYAIVVITFSTPAQPLVSISPSPSINTESGAGTWSATATATATGGVGTFSYAWSRLVGSRISVSGGQTATFSTALQTAENFTEVFQVTATDTAGNVATAQVNVSFTDPTLPFTLSVSPTSVNNTYKGAAHTFTFSITATASGGHTPYTYAWTLAGGINTTITSGATTATVTISDNVSYCNFNSSTATIKVTDAYGGTQSILVPITDTTTRGTQPCP